MCNLEALLVLSESFTCHAEQSEASPSKVTSLTLYARPFAPLRVTGLSICHSEERFVRRRISRFDWSFFPLLRMTNRLIGRERPL